MNNEVTVSKKTKRIVRFSILALVIGALVAAYSCLIKFYLLDFTNMEYIEFSYVYDDEVKNPTVRIDKVYETSDYPAKFRIPGKLLGKKVTEIADNAFAYLDRLEEVKFPNTIEKIGEKAFYNCTNLKKINIPSNLDSIGFDAFGGTAFINNQGDGDVTLGKVLYTYKGELPENTAIVSNSSEIETLGDTYSNYIPLDKYVYIGQGAFNGKSNLKYVSYSGEIESIEKRLFSNCKNLSIVKINEGVKEISDAAFEGCSGITSFTFASTIESIGDTAFKNSSISGEDGKVVIPTNVNYIGQGAFQNCEEIKEINVPNKITSLNDSVFEGCSNLVKVNLEGENKTNSSISYLGAGAFKNTAITEFNVPFNVQVIKESAFEGCEDLESVYVYDNTEGTMNGETKQGLQKISPKAFANCTSLKEIITLDKDGNKTSPNNEINFPNATLVSMGENSGDSDIFLNCTSISTIKVPSSVTWIPATFAKGCTNLSSFEITAPISGKTRIMVAIYGAAFQDCINLTRVVIPYHVANFGANAFSGCEKLSEIVFEGDSRVQVLARGMFSGCSALTSFVTPSTTNSVKENCFSNCTNLESVVFTEKVKNTDKNVFIGCDSTKLKIFLEFSTMPIGFSKGWNAVSNGSEETFDTYLFSETEPAEEGNYWHYVNDVVTIW